MEGNRPGRVTLGAFAVLVLIGGFNFVAVRYSNRELPPLFGAGARFAIAAVLLIAFVVLRRVALPRGRVLLVTVVYGVLTFTVGYAFAYWALQSLSAGIGAVVFGATPLLTVLFAAAHGLERLSMRGVGGALLAVVGILILANPSDDVSVPMLRLAAMIVASAAAAEAGVLLKLFPTDSPVMTNGLAMAVGAAGLLLWSLLSGEAWPVPEQGSTWTALLYLAIPGSIGLFALFLFVLGRWTASGVSYMAALFPVVAMIGGALILDESITVNGVIGGLVVVAAVYLGALRGGGSRVSSVPATQPLPGEA